MDVKNAILDWQALTPLSRQFNDPYFSLVDGLAETHYVFLKHNGLPDKWKIDQDFVIGETGFGTALNFLVTASLWLSSPTGEGHLTYYSIEKHPLSRDDLAKVFKNWPQFNVISNKILSNYPDTLPGFYTLTFKEEKITLVLMFGDVLPMLENLQSRVDCWYLDGFAPAKNPEMWSLAACQCLASLSHERTSFATFTAAGFVRRNLQSVGFKITKTAGFGKKREMLSGRFSENRGNKKDNTPWFSLARISKTKAKNVVIVGGGLAGLSCAWMLGEQGVNCTIIEAGDSLASDASGNVAGIVMPRFTLDLNLESQFYLSSFLFAVSCLNSLKQADEEFTWQQSGVLQFATSQRIERIKKLGFSENFLQGLTQCKASSVAGASLSSGAILFPSAGYVNPFQLCEILAKTSVDFLTIKARTKIKNLEKQGDDWQVYDDNNQLIAKSKTIIFANGFDAQRILQLDGLNLSKSRGQITQIPSQRIISRLRMPVCDDGYIIPQTNGSHVIGATYSAENEDLNLSLEDHLENLRGVNEILSSDLDVDMDKLLGRVSFRTTSLDHLPLVGPIPNQAAYLANYEDIRHGRAHDNFLSAEYLSGLYLTTGHGSRGLVSCFSSAAYLMSLICSKPVTLPGNIINRLHPARFIIRALKKSSNRR